MSIDSEAMQLTPRQLIETLATYGICVCDHEALRVKLAAADQMYLNMQRERDEERDNRASDRLRAAQTIAAYQAEMRGLKAKLEAATVRPQHAPDCESVVKEKLHYARQVEELRELHASMEFTLMKKVGYYDDK